MKFTNKLGLPDTLVRATIANNALYSKGAAERSVTQLIQAPRIDMLRKRHFTDMEKDISEEWFALFGSAVHRILELGATPAMIVEERLFATVDGWTFSGATDVQEPFPDGTMDISDYKITTAFQVQKTVELKKEWEAQLNILAYLIWVNKGINVKNAAVVAIIRDWARYMTVSPTYPQSPIVRIPARLWSHDEQLAYIKQKINDHRHAQMLMELDEELPLCSDEDRWMKPSTWAIIKTGNKKATKTFDGEAECQTYLAELQAKPAKGKQKASYRVEHRPAGPSRCLGNYCGVAEWCSQWAQDRHLYELQGPPADDLGTEGGEDGGPEGLGAEGRADLYPETD